MNKRWSTKQLKDFAEINPLETLKKGVVSKKFSMDKLKVGSKFLDRYEESPYNCGAKFRNNDVLVAGISPCLENGKTAKVTILEENELAFGSTEFIVLRSNELSDSDFLYYLSISPFFRKKAISFLKGTSGRKRVEVKNIACQNFQLPPLHEQRKIASVLSALDDQIELNNKINQELETLAQTLYDYWFIQFEFPNEEGKPYKSSGGKMVWNEELKREIPEGWEVKQLGEEFSIKSGYAFSSEYYDTNGKYGLVTIKNVNNGVVDNKTDNFIHSIPKKLPEYCKLEPHDILITLTGNVGRLGIVANENLLLNQRVGLIECRESFMNNFAYLLFNSDKIKYEIQNLAVGTSQKNLSPLAIEKVVNLFPSKKTLIDFQIKTESLFNEIISNRQQNQELIQLRDYLLPLLMNGQVTVSDSIPE